MSVHGGTTPGPTDDHGVGPRPRTRERFPTTIVAVVLAVAAVAVAATILAWRTGVPSPGSARVLPGSPPAATAPTASPSRSGPPARWLAYPGQPYPGTRPFCEVVNQQHLTPQPYSATAGEAIPGTDFQQDGTEMKCDLYFHTKPATGAYRLHTWAYADAGRTSRDFVKMRQDLTTFPDRGNKATTRGDVSGVGQRAYEVYTPVTVSDQPNIRIQPGRHLELLVLDANLILRLSVSTLRPMGTTFPDADHSYRDAVHRSVLEVLQRLRDGRANAPCCN
jgi:hypothetical protein